jgi:hypothetical protein
MKPGLEQQRLYFSEQFVENWRSAQKQLDFSELLAEHWYFVLALKSMLMSCSAPSFQLHVPCFRYQRQ